MGKYNKINKSKKLGLGEVRLSKQRNFLNISSMGIKNIILSRAKTNIEHYFLNCLHHTIYSA